MASKWESNEDVQRFREYLRIPTVQPDVNYDECVSFLKRQADELGLPVQIFHPAYPTKPVVILTWQGTDPTLESILLNSHMDVVPVDLEHWTYKPFEAEIDNEGRIFGRGTQDMKSVGMQYLRAIKALKEHGVQLKRTVHLMYVPDEEIGGENGTRAFVRTDAFKRLNVGFALDEGIATADETFSVFYAERSEWRPHFKCYGTTGHGALLHEKTAGEKIRFIIDRFMDYRSEQVKLLKDNPTLGVGDVTSVNLTILQGGVQINVVPTTLSVKFDVRLSINVDHDEFERMLRKWCEEAGGDIDLCFEAKRPKVPPTRIDDTNPYWIAIYDTLVNDLKLKIKPLVSAVRTDSCYIREIGIPAIGFSPLNHTPVLLHSHNEYVSADVYLAGIKIYKNLITKLANV